MAKKPLIPTPELRVRNLHKRWSFVAQIFLYCLIIIYPLYIGFNSHGGAATFYKLDYFYTLSAVVLGVFFICYCISLMDGQIPDMHIGKRFMAGVPYEKALIVYLLLTLVSFLFFSADKEEAFWGVFSQSGGLLLQACYAVAFFVIARYYKPKQRDIIIAVVAGALTAAYGIMTYFGIDPLAIVPGRYAGSYGRHVVFYSTMSNYNFYSPYICIMFALGAGWMIHSDNNKSLLLLPALLILFAMNAFGNMRGGFAGILGAFALGTPFILRGRKSAGKLLVLAAGMMVVMYLEDIARLYTEALQHGAGLMNDYLRGAHVPASVLTRNGVYVLFDTLQFNARQVPGTLRGIFLPCAAALGILGALVLVSRDAWFAKMPKVSAKVFRRAWYIALLIVVIIGVIMLPTIAEKTGIPTLQEAAGLSRGDLNDNYMNGRMYVWNRAFRLFPASPIFGYGPDGFNGAFNQYYAYDLVDDWPSIMSPAVFDKAHNDFLQILIDGGILGLAAYVAFFALLIWCARKWTANYMVAAGMFALICYLVQSNFNYTMSVNGPMFWTVVGMFAAGIRTMHQEAAS